MLQSPKGRQAAIEFPSAGRGGGGRAMLPEVIEEFPSGGKGVFGRMLPGVIVEWEVSDHELTALRGCVAGALVHLTSLQFVAHVGVHPVVLISLHALVIEIS